MAGVSLSGCRQTKRFFWQDEISSEFPLNGRYERCTRCWTNDEGHQKDAPMWRRLPAVLPDTAIAINRDELVVGQVVPRDVAMPEGSPVRLRIEVFPRRIKTNTDVWLLTVVLRNSSQPTQMSETREAALYQTYFEVVAEGGHLVKYPESQRRFAQLDPEEQSLSLLYRESSTMGNRTRMRCRLGRRTGASTDVVIRRCHAGGSNAEHDARHKGRRRQSYPALDADVSGTA